jgi:2-keto-4-pentenoate hydratase/2-oxohepta-3-ene-1,7-dioic acid hydratase in catechol pathway
MFITRVGYQGRSFWAELYGERALLLDWELREVVDVFAQDVQSLPLLNPGKVICVGLNYYAHAREMGKAVPDEPLLFLKPGSAVIGPCQPIYLPTQSSDVHYEGELAVVIGRVCRNASVSEARDAVLGCTCANDVTARDLQTKDGLYARAKGFDTFCPLGPVIQTKVEALDDAVIKTTVDEQLVQSGRTSDMIASPLAVVSFISKIMTLHPGDVILTGTPPGVGPLQSGNKVCVEIENIGQLCNPVIGQQT